MTVSDVFSPSPKGAETEPVMSSSKSNTGGDGGHHITAVT